MPGTVTWTLVYIVMKAPLYPDDIKILVDNHEYTKKGCELTGNAGAQARPKNQAMTYLCVPNGDYE